MIGYARTGHNRFRHRRSRSVIASGAYGPVGCGTRITAGTAHRALRIGTRQRLAERGSGR
jgi:hypothetical protein